MNETKTCKDCGEEKTLSEFPSFKKKKVSGDYSILYRPKCKPCQSAYNQRKRNKEQDNLKERKRREARRGMWQNLPPGTTKECSGYKGEPCVNPKGPTLPATDQYFSNHPTGVYGLRVRCKMCQSIENKAVKSGMKKTCAECKEEFNPTQMKKLGSGTGTRYYCLNCLNI